MKKSLFHGGVVALFAIGLTFGFLGTAEAAKKSIFGPCSTSKKCQDKPIAPATIGSMTLAAQPVSSLKGRVFAQWADNPSGEIIFGIQYWNTSEPGETGDAPGRASDDRDVSIPDPLFVCCSWGFEGLESERNNPYAGWYTPQTTVRLRVKDASLMKQLTVAAQNLVAMEVQLDGNTVTSFTVLSGDD